MLNRLLLGWSLVLIASMGFFFPAAEAQTQSGIRRQVSVWPLQDSSLSPVLITALRQQFPQFDFWLAPRSLRQDPGPVLAEFKRWQQSHRHEILQLQDSDQVQIAEMSWSGLEIRRLANSAFTLVPSWNYEPLALTGPHKRAGTSGEYWSIDVESRVHVSLSVFRVSGDYVQLAGAPSHTLSLRKEIPIPDIERLRVLVSKATGAEINLDNPAEAAQILELLKKVQPFREILQSEPAGYLEPDPAQAGSYGFADLAAELQAAVVDFDLKAANGSRTTERSGQVGLTTLLRAGTTTLGLMGYVPKYVVPQGQLELQYDVGALIGAPDLLLTLSGGGALPQPAFELTAQPSFPGFGVPGGGLTTPGFGVPGGGLPNPAAQLMAYSVEFGLLKRFTFGAWGLSAGLRGGLLGAVLMQANGLFNPMQPDPAAMAFGGTALLGVSYQITPQFLVGLDAGFRYFDGGFWQSAAGGFPQPFQPLMANPLQSIGPDLSLYTGYTF